MKYVKVWAVDSSGVCKCGKGTDCPRPGKHPVGATWSAVDIEEFELDSAYNWGLVTGEVNGIFVVDCDVHGEVNGILAVGELGTLPTTRTIRTGSGGLHYYFKWPGTAIANSAAKLAPGVDIRGDSGYVLVPPSVNSKGPYTLVSNAPIAAAPAWLLERLSRPQAEESATAVSLGEAAPDDISAARAEVLMMPRAISGQGGDDLTFRVAAILANDYGLSEEEGFPIFAEWNARCQPPWGPAELKLKWRGGLKYATGRYGAKRTGGLRSAVKTLLDNWSSNNLGEAGLPALVKGLERAAREHPITDRTVLDALCAQVTKATGLPAGKSGLKNAVRETDPNSPGPAGRVEMRWTPSAICTMVKEAEAALATKDVYRQGDRVVIPDDGRLVGVDPYKMTLILNDALYVTQWNEKKGCDVEIALKPDFAKYIISNRNLAKIEGVLTCPSMDSTGRIISAKGLDKPTGLFLHDPPDLGTIRGTKADGAEAATFFRHIFRGFPFVDPASLSVAVSALVTPIMHAAYKVSPAHGLSATNSGAGKSYLYKVCAYPALGFDPSASDMSHDSKETDARLTAAMLEGRSILCLDNVSTELTGDLLCQAIEQSSVEIRPLGRTALVKVNKRMMVLATGINLSIGKDNVRRWLLSRLDTKLPYNDNRTFDGTPPLDELMSDRTRVLRAALNLVKSYLNSGVPPVPRPLASFEIWSNTVRSALVYHGFADPVASQTVVKEGDSDTAAFMQVVRLLQTMGPGARHSVKAILDRLPEGEDWVAEIAGERHNVVALAKWLKRKSDNRIDGYVMVCDRNSITKQNRYGVVPADSLL